MEGGLFLDKKISLAFMFSNWYSGATLFAILLNNHNKITCNGEILFSKLQTGRFPNGVELIEAFKNFGLIQG